MFIYSPMGTIKLENGQTIREIIEQQFWSADKARIMNKKELAIADNPRTMETIWVAFAKT